MPYIKYAFALPVSAWWLHRAAMQDCLHRGQAGPRIEPLFSRAGHCIFRPFLRILAYIASIISIQQACLASEGGEGATGGSPARAR